jgi:hypothetical protein
MSDDKTICIYSVSNPTIKGAGVDELNGIGWSHHDFFISAMASTLFDGCANSGDGSRRHHRQSCTQRVDTQKPADDKL